MFFRKKKVEEPQTTKAAIQTNPTNLKSALKTVINGLEDDVLLYEWRKPSHCNCGLVVQAVLGLSRYETNQIFSILQEGSEKKERKTWKENAQYYCSVTGQPIHQIFKILSDHGMTPKDIVHLEYLSNKAILELSGIDTSDKNYYDKRENVLLYLKAWLQIIEEKELEKLSDSALEEAKKLIASANIKSLETQSQ